MTAKSVAYGATASALLLALYAAIVSLVSGTAFLRSQFAADWYFIVTLAAGFGLQIALYQYLRFLHASAGKSMLAVSGTTSTAAMISCCAHYLANLLPILAGSGLAALVGQYQTEIYWVGLLMNAVGIAIIWRRIYLSKKHHA